MLRGQGDKLEAMFLDTGEDRRCRLRRSGRRPRRSHRVRPRRGSARRLESAADYGFGNHPTVLGSTRRWPQMITKALNHSARSGYECTSATRSRTAAW